MKPIHVFLMILVAALAGAGGWFSARRAGHHPSDRARPEAIGDTIYTCSMHPQVRQNKPGTCPFCGMGLAPLNSVATSDLPPGSVMLGSNRVNAIHVQTVAARRLPLNRSLRVAGVIDDNDARHRFLSAYVDGRIDRLFVNYVGAEVTEGQPLATIYSPMLLAAEREYVSLARRAASQDTPAARDEQRRLLAGARQRLLQLGLNESSIASLPSKPDTSIHTELLAPMSGTVVGRMAYEGLYVKEGEKLFELADFSTMWFRFEAYERDLAWLKPGQSVDVTTPSVPGKVYRAPIAFIDPNVNDPTRSARVRVELANPLVVTNGSTRRELLHKIYAEGVVQVSVPEVLAVPRTAVLAPGRPYVFVDKGDGVYEQRRVNLGRAGDELWEVLDGLQEGELVVTTGNLLIDAQAQLDSAGAVHDHGADGATSSLSATPSEPMPPLTDAQRQAATNLLAAADAVTTALSSDNLDAFNQHASALHAAAASLSAALTNGAWAALAGKVASAAHPARANDLKAARQAFHPFSMAVSELAASLRRHGGVSEVRIFQCPMVKQAFPGAPKTGRWIQLQPQIRNPYFGSEMLDCGNEVKP